VNCNLCPDFKDNLCTKLTENLSEMTETPCLLKGIIMLLRDIWSELAIEADDRDEGEEWKYDKD